MPTLAYSATELLKKPLHTSIAVDKDEFVDLALEDKLHIIVNVKDFRAILQHAQLIAGDLSASYSRPGRPMKLHYSADGIVCEFVLMTVGTQTASLAQKLRKGKGKTVAVNGGLEAATASNSSRAGSVVVNGATPAPSAPQEQAQAAVPRPAPRPATATFEMRPPPLPPVPPALPMASTLSSESLFVLQPDEDSQWEPMNEDEEDDMGERERLGWDTGSQQVRWTICTASTPKIGLADHCSTRRLRCA
jgi:cell cycle checkpoint control protein RAD9A